MARVFLTDETYNAATDGAEINGSAGTEQVNVFAGTTGLDVRSSVERVDLPGDIADFTFSSFGASLTIRDGNGDIVATVSDAGGKEIVFGDGALDVAYDGTSNTLTLGGETVGSTAAAITPAASEIDTGTTSETANGTVTPGGPGQTFTLTTGSDISGVLTGSAGTTNTDGDDTFVGTQATLTAGDVLVGGSGNDTLNVAASGAVAAPSSVSGVEAVNYNVSAFATPTIDVDNIVGVGTTITVNNIQAGGTNSVDLDNVGSGATVVAGTGVTGTLDVASEGDVTIQGGAATTINVGGTAATTDKAAISGAGTVVLDTNTGGQQVENLTLSGSGAAVTFDLNTGDAPETLTFTGDQSVTLIAAAAEVDGEVATDSTTAGTTTIRLDANTAATFDLDALAVDVINVAANTTGATYTVANNQAVTLSVDATASTFDAALASGAETLNLTVAASQAGATTVLDFETVNLTVNDGAATTGTITLANLDGSNAAGSVINVSGGDNLTLTDADATSLNASGLTGVLTATIAADLNNIVGGSGNDVFNAFDTNFTLDGGAGTADKLTFAATTDLSDNTFTVTNVEVVELTGATNTLTLNSTDISGKTLVVTGDGTDDALVIEMVTTPTLDLSNVTVDDTDVGVTIDLTATAGVNNTITGSNADDTITNAGAGAITVNGNGGADVLTTGTAADVINGGEGADAITGGTGADDMTGGAGVDTFSFGTNGSIAGTDLDQILDFNTGGSDVLDFGAAGVLLAAETNGTTATTDVDTSAGGLITFATADDTFAEKVVAVQADAELDAAGSVAFFEDSGNSYVYYAGAAVGNADDQLVELVGVTGLTTITGGGDLTIA